MELKAVISADPIKTEENWGRLFEEIERLKFSNLSFLPVRNIDLGEEKIEFIRKDIKRNYLFNNRLYAK